MKKCPYCAEEIQDEAIKCRYCGEWLKEAKLESRDNDNKMQHKKISVEEKVSQVRPWVRFWARIFDISLFSFVIGILLYLFYPSFLLELYANDILLSSIPVLFLWIFFEAALLSTNGYTPGKWLLGTRVTTLDGTKLNDVQALKRSFTLWGQGLGLGIPIISQIAQLIAYSELKSKGITGWDEGRFVVSHKKIPPFRILVIILFFMGLFFLYQYLT